MFIFLFQVCDKVGGHTVESLTGQIVKNTSKKEEEELKKILLYE